MPKRTKAIVPLFLPRNGIVLSKKKVYSIGLNVSEKSQLDYYNDRLKELELTLEKYKTIINNLHEKRTYIKALEGFRKMLTWNCVNQLDRKITILQCQYRKETEICKVKECKPLNEFIEKFLK